MAKTILITVDLEDWFQVENLRPSFPHELWDKCQIRVEQSTDKLLKLFERHNIKATFFVLGWLAERLPALIRRIQSAGHEIASHGYGHQLCTELDSTALKDDILRSKKILESIIDAEIKGYRAPNFSINESLPSILQETGFIYDSSYNDFAAHGRYGSLPGSWATNNTGILKNKTGFYEIPVRNIKIFGKSIPWAGGGYFRLLPVWLFKKGVEFFLRQEKFYLFYCHPWEFDPDQPRAKGLKFNHSFRHYVNLAPNLNKLNYFLTALKGNRFITCSQLINLS